MGTGIHPVESPRAHERDLCGVRSKIPCSGRFMVRLNVLPPRIVSHMSGVRDVWSEPKEDLPVDPVAAVRDCLREVLDPEIPISLVDLGLIYDIRWSPARVTVDVSYTATACPCMEFIREDIRDRLEREPWISSVDIMDVWDPPWSRERISPEGRMKLLELGVGS